jgi:hypothetical protein
LLFLLIVRGRGEVVLVLMVLCDLEAAKDDKVALVIDLRTILGHCGDLVVSGVGRIGKKLLQCQQTTGRSQLLLSVDLLQAQDIGIEPEDLGPHEGDAFIACRLLPRFVVEVFQVEGGDAEFG